MSKKIFAGYKMGRKKQGQSILEYLIILTLLASLTLISLSAFKTQLQAGAENLFSNVAERIINADGNN